MLLSHFFLFCSTSLINLIKHGISCKILYLKQANKAKLDKTSNFSEFYKHSITVVICDMLLCSKGKVVDNIKTHVDQINK